MRDLSLRLAATRFAAFLLVASPLVWADKRILFAEDRQVARDQWQTVTANMSPLEYRKAYRHNQRLARDVVKSYSTGALRSAGVPDTGIRLMGVAAGLAVDGDARLSLNRSENRRLALEFKDVVDGDRSVVLGIRLRW